MLTVWSVSMHSRESKNRKPVTDEENVKITGFIELICY